MPVILIKQQEEFLSESYKESEEEIQVVVEEDVKFGIWELWKKVLENMQAQNDIDKYRYS